MDVFCVIPFHCYETNGQTLENIGCCRWPKGTSISSVQHSIENGKRHPACTSCWKAEDQGTVSERQTHNSTMDWLLDKDIEQIAKEAVAGNTDTYMVKLYTSNLCNGLCVTCGPEASTAWQKLEDQSITYMTQSIDDADVDWSQVVYLSLVGGEPLLEKQNWQLLHKLAENNRTDIFVTVVTNATVQLSEQQEQLLERFTNLNICVSVDGVGPVYEYMRYPAKWTLFEQNVLYFKQITSNVSASVMISNLNIRYIDQLFDWLEINNIPYLAKNIQEPDYYAPSALTNEMRAEVLNTNPVHAIHYIDSELDNSNLLDHTKQDVARQDQLKGIDIKNYLGSWGEFLK